MAAVLVSAMHAGVCDDHHQAYCPNGQIVGRWVPAMVVATLIENPVHIDGMRLRTVWYELDGRHR